MKKRDRESRPAITDDEIERIKNRFRIDHGAYTYRMPDGSIRFIGRHIWDDVQRLLQAIERKASDGED